MESSLWVGDVQFSLILERIGDASVVSSLGDHSVLECLCEGLVSHLLVNESAVNNGKASRSGSPHVLESFLKLSFLSLQLFFVLLSLKFIEFLPGLNLSIVLFFISLSGSLGSCDSLFSSFISIFLLLGNLLLSSLSGLFHLCFHLLNELISISL